MEVQPYLFFEGRCEQALSFYKSVLDAKVEMLMRFKDSPDPESCSPGDGDKVMHCSFRIGDSLVMASDGHCSGKQDYAGFNLSLSCKTVAEGEKLFAALSEGGKVVMPFMKTFWSPGFGMATDKFGIGWMINVMP